MVPHLSHHLRCQGSDWPSSPWGGLFHPCQLVITARNKGCPETMQRCSGGQGRFTPFWVTVHTCTAESAAPEQPPLSTRGKAQQHTEESSVHYPKRELLATIHVSRSPIQQHRGQAISGMGYIRRHFIQPTQPRRLLQMAIAGPPYCDAHHLTYNSAGPKGGFCVRSRLPPAPAPRRAPPTWPPRPA